MITNTGWAVPKVLPKGLPKVLATTVILANMGATAPTLLGTITLAER